MTHTHYHHTALLLLRLTFGLSMLLGHGWPKLMKLVGDGPVKFYDFMGLGPEISLGLAVFAEAVCALLITIGMFTRLASVPLIVTMLVAILGAHWGDPFGKYEKALLYLVPYICLLIAGPGWYSIDAQIRKTA
jgi:putative oxidoreductase